MCYPSLGLRRRHRWLGDLVLKLCDDESIKDGRLTVFNKSSATHNSPEWAPQCNVQAVYAVSPCCMMGICHSSQLTACCYRCLHHIKSCCHANSLIIIRLDYCNSLLPRSLELYFYSRVLILNHECQSTNSTRKNW